MNTMVQRRSDAGQDSAPRRLAGDLRLLGFLAVGFAWLRTAVDPSLTYHGAGLTTFPSFSPDPFFLREHLTQPGGPVRYVAAWLSQWMHDPLAGTVLLVALAAAVAIATDGLASRLAGRRLPGLRYAPALAFLVLDGRYLQTVEWQLGGLAALLAAWGGLRLVANRPTGQRTVLGLALLATVYYLAGRALLVAAPVLIVVELSRPGGTLPGLAWLAWTAILPGLSVYAGFDRPLAVAYRNLAAPAMRNEPTGSVALAMTIGWPALALLVAGLAVQTARRPVAGRPRSPVWPWLGWAVVVALLPRLASDPYSRGKIALAALTARGDWPAAIRVADELPSRAITFMESYEIILALAHTGQLGEVMFRYPMNPQSYLRSTAGGQQDSAWLSQQRAAYGLQVATLDLELGFLNGAEHGLHETLEVEGTYPRLLLPMAWLQVVKGRPEAAKVFLRLAAAQPISRGEARELLAALDRDPTLAGHPVIEPLRRAELRRDLPAEKSITRQFEALVREHPANRLAAEYLMAWYLLSHQLDRFMAVIPRFPAFGRTNLPRHYEEAILVWEVLAGRPARLGPWHVRPDTRARFEAFVQALGCDSDDLPAILGPVAQPPDFALRLADASWCDTYYHYRLFGTSGIPR